MKRLRSLTIIPPELYVQRDADRQIRAIIENMGRPGYVLVARQMGKTNLLLHAKAVHSVATDVFAYLDVSNPFPEIRSFLRNICEVIIETSLVNLSGVRQQIIEDRKLAERLPHKEHEHELRLILSALPGKLVICLDEIDALTGLPYSDQVFSFIRSVYFSGRANFQPFSRLTYLLSGVAEPADIIKNRDVSPFNIGEKILLDDFSYAEFSDFLLKANLALSRLAKDRIYFWTNGHPRMTWDVCSELESFISAGHTITPALVDDRVKYLYFSDLDIPPVDQIRRVAGENAEVRDALMSIHYNRGETVGSALRTRLYLAGISKMTPQGGSVLFKNKILEEALSETFLVSLRPTTQEDFFASGELDFKAQKYDRALIQFSDAARAAHDEKDDALADRAHYWLGRTYFELANFESCIAELNIERPGLTEEEQLLRQFYLGVARYQSGFFKEAVEHLQKFKTESTNGTAQYEASAYIAASLLRLKIDISGVETYSRSVIAAKTTLLNSPGFSRAPSASLASAYLSLAEASLLTGRKEQAAAELDEGFELAPLDLQVKICVFRHDLESERQRGFYLNKAGALVTGSSLFSSSAKTAETISYESLFELLARIVRARQPALAESLLTHVFSAAKGNAELRQCIDALGAASMERGGTELTALVHEHAYRVAKLSLDAVIRREVLSTLCIVAPRRFLVYAHEYFGLFVEPYDAPQLGELIGFINLVQEAVASRDRALADLAIDIVLRKPVDYEALPEIQRQSWEILRDYLVLIRDLSFAPSPGELAVARAFLARLSTTKAFELTSLKLDWVRAMQIRVAQLVGKTGARTSPSIRKGTKLGRNDIVKVSYAGEQRTGKYKKFQADIDAGVCELIEPPQFRSD